MLKTELIPSREKSKRLLIMLHGLGDSIAGYRWLPSALEIPWLNYLLVNAPDEYYGGYSWYDFAGDMAPGVERSRKLLSDLLDAQVKAGYRAEDMLLGGFSQGCLMSIEVGLRYPHRLAGIIGISGYVCDPDKLLREIPPIGFKQRILMTHGSMDPMIPLKLVRQQVAQLNSAGLHIEWYEFEKAHTIAGEAELEVIRNFIRGCWTVSG